MATTSGVDHAAGSSDTGPDTGPDAGENLSELVGERIRHMRRARSMTLVDLAERCELSHPFLSQLERGLARPSMASLERIARALDTSQVELLSFEPHRPDVDVPAVSVIRAGAGNAAAYGEGTGRLLVDWKRPFHPIEVTSDNGEFGTEFVHIEDEWAYLLDGQVEMELAGRRIVLGPGDSVYYAGGTTHRWRSIDGTRYRLIVVKERPAAP